MTMGKPAGIVLHLDLATNTLANTTLNASTHITHNVILQQTKILEANPRIKTWNFERQDEYGSSHT